MVHEQADAVATHLKPLGWTLITLDDCWGGERLANGSYSWDPVRFPSGMPALAQHVKAKGLDLGLYMAAGNETCNDGGTHLLHSILKITLVYGIFVMKYTKSLKQGGRTRSPAPTSTTRSNCTKSFENQSENERNHSMMPWPTLPDINRRALAIRGALLF